MAARKAAEAGGPLPQVAQADMATAPTTTAHAPCLAPVRRHPAAPAGTGQGQHLIRRDHAPGPRRAAAPGIAGAAATTAGAEAPAAIATTVTTDAAEAAVGSGGNGAREDLEICGNHRERSAFGLVGKQKKKGKGTAVLLALVVSFQHPALLGLMGFR